MGTFQGLQGHPALQVCSHLIGSGRDAEVQLRTQFTAALNVNRLADLRHPAFACICCNEATGFADGCK